VPGAVACCDVIATNTNSTASHQQQQPANLHEYAVMDLVLLRIAFNQTRMYEGWRNAKQTNLKARHIQNLKQH